MSELVATIYDSRADAERARSKLIAMQQEYLVELDDIVVAERTQKGSVKLHQAVNLVSRGVLQGGFLGTLVGLIFLNPLFGLAIGAGMGAVGGVLADFGINDEYMKQLAGELEDGKAILFLLLRKPPTDKAMQILGQLDAAVLRTSLASDDETRLRAAFASARNEGMLAD